MVISTDSHSLSLILHRNLLIHRHLHWRISITFELYFIRTCHPLTLIRLKQSLQRALRAME